MIKELLIKLIGIEKARKLYFLKNDILDGYSKKIYSQEGEDLILSEFLSNVKNGFYVDIGAHHPVRFSNTYMFYKKGWNGINIDAMPGSMRIFKRKRSRDINLEVGISGKKGEMVYYMFDEPALNGFSKKLSKERNKISNFKIIEEKKIKTYPLCDILDKYLPESQKIDFMSIDVEGLDLMVLKSNNWDRFIPSYILVESIADNLEDVTKNSIYKFLSDKGYSIVGKTYRTSIFKRNKKC